MAKNYRDNTIKGKQYTIGEKYIFSFVGDGMIKCFKTIYTTKKGNLYGLFDCGIEVRIDSFINTGSIQFFNIINSKLYDYVNCNLYIFSDEENMKKLLPAIIKDDLMGLNKKIDYLLKEYMKLVDDNNSMEDCLKSIKNNTFELKNLF